MKAFASVGAMVTLCLAQASHAAVVGTVEYALFQNGASPFYADLGGVNPTLPDAAIQTNGFNGAVALPAGLPLGYQVEIRRRFVGDAFGLHDEFYFQVDPATFVPGASTYGRLVPTPDWMASADRGMSPTVSVWETDSTGSSRSLITTLSFANNFHSLGMLTSGQAYLLTLDGRARNSGVYEFDYVQVIPLPQTALLLITGLFGLAVTGALGRGRGAF